MAVKKSPYGPAPSKVSTYRPTPVKVAPVARPAPMTYAPTNPGWGNAGTAAKLAALNPSGQATWGWTQQQADSYASQDRPWEGYVAPTLGGGGGSLGGGPDLSYWGHSLAALEGQRDEDLGSLRIGAGGRIKQALIDLGLEDTSQLSGDIKGYIDEPTMAAAKANKYSVFSQIAEQTRKATAASRAKLAARGMLSSGQLSKEAQDIVATGEKGRYAGVRDFTGQAQGVLEQLASAQRNWASRIAEARMQAAAAGWGGGSGGGGGGGGGETFNAMGQMTSDRGTGVGRPGEWADLGLIKGWDPYKNSDAEYDLTGATPVGDGTFIGPNGARYDDHGRRI